MGDEIEIANMVSGETYPRIGVLPSYSVTWMDDSNTMVVFEHLAGGSDAVLIHFNGQKWQVTRTAPPEDNYDHVAVVRVTPERGIFQISYRADVREGEQVSYFLITSDVDPQTGERRNENVKRVSYETYLSLHPLGPK